MATPSEEDKLTPSLEVPPQGEQEPAPAEPAPKANTNWNNGKRRIEQRQSAKARIRELEARIKELEGKEDDYSKFQRENLSERIGDMNAITADAEVNEFASRAEQWFGDDTEQFMEQTYRYAQYINANEPDLLKFASREYGPILLHEWYKRMDNPQLRQQWLQMTGYEKGMVLSNFYNQIAEVVKRSAQPTQSVPAPSGGRQSAASAPGDDFGSALGDALNRHKRK